MDETEKNVLDFMISQKEDNIRCGCVEGLIENGFSANERALLNEHGLYKRFSF